MIDNIKQTKLKQNRVLFSVSIFYVLRLLCGRFKKPHHAQPKLHHARRM